MSYALKKRSVDHDFVGLSVSELGLHGLYSFDLCAKDCFVMRQLDLFCF